jgi:hypothetical protein
MTISIRELPMSAIGPKGTIRDGRLARLKNFFGARKQLAGSEKQDATIGLL